MAAASARADYAGEIDLSPLDALLYTVRRGAQLVHYWQQKALNAETDEAHTYATDQESRALGNLNQWSNNAVKAGVAKAQVEIAARLADTLIAAAEDGLAALEALGVEIGREQRAAFAAAFGRNLQSLEQGTIEVEARDV